MNIEDQTHLLFSSIINSRRDFSKIHFENEDFPTGIGPILQESNQYRYILDGSCGILGFYHPLIIKSRLHSALNPYFLAIEADLELLKKELEDFLSSFLSERVYLSDQIGDQIYQLEGRTPTFFTSHFRKSLTNNDYSTFRGVFPFDINLSTHDDQSKPLRGLTYSAFHETSQILRFLKLGNFYGDKALIKNREHQLSQVFTKIEGVSDFYGLTFNISSTLAKKCQERQISTLENKFIFPLSFNDKIINDIKNLILK